MNFARAWSACALALGLVAAGVSSARADAVYSFGPDATGAGRVLSTLGAGTATPVATLGDGSNAFNGGLVYSAAASRFFAIANDGNGASSLVAFSATAPTVFTLNQGLAVSGFTGGLALNGTTLYAISNDPFGVSSLYSMDLGGGSLTLIGTLGGALYTGLAYDGDDHELYGVAADASGVGRSLRRIRLSGGLTDDELFQLGDGSQAFNGGLAYDAQADLFKVIANDPMATSSLMSFDLSGAASLAVLQPGFAAGFLNAGLAIGPDDHGGPGALPEPATPLLLLALGLAWAASRRAARPC